MTITQIIRAIKPFVLRWIEDAEGSSGSIPDHDHSGDAGDGGTFDAANLTSNGAFDGDVLTADGAGGAAWEAAAGGTDPDAIHDNVSSEIAALTEKAAPVSADLVLIEDSEASNAKKKVQVGNLGGGDVGIPLDLWATGGSAKTSRTHAGHGASIDWNGYTAKVKRIGARLPELTSVSVRFRLCRIDTGSPPTIQETLIDETKTVTCSEGEDYVFDTAINPELSNGNRYFICAHRTDGNTMQLFYGDWVLNSIYAQYIQGWCGTSENPFQLVAAEGYRTMVKLFLKAEAY